MTQGPRNNALWRSSFMSVAHLYKSTLAPTWLVFSHASRSSVSIRTRLSLRRRKTLSMYTSSPLAPSSSSPTRIPSATRRSMRLRKILPLPTSQRPTSCCSPTRWEPRGPCRKVCRKISLASLQATPGWVKRVPCLTCPLYTMLLLAHKQCASIGFQSQTFRWSCQLMYWVSLKVYFGQEWTTCGTVYSTSMRPEMKSQTLTKCPALFPWLTSIWPRCTQTLPKICRKSFASTRWRKQEATHLCYSSLTTGVRRHNAWLGPIRTHKLKATSTRVSERNLTQLQNAARILSLVPPTKVRAQLTLSRTKPNSP